MQSLTLFRRHVCIAALSASLFALPAAGQSQSNNAFSIVISEPTNGSAFVSPVTVHITASVYDATDAVASVVFSANPPPPLEGPSLLLGNTAIPQEIGKECWLDHLNLPQGRHEKQKNQTNTVPV